jgi:hypothetical protein
MQSILTRQDFIDILKKGETVVYRGQIVRNYSDIPSEATLSLGNPVAEEKAKDSILQEMERLKAELELLKSTSEDKTPKVRKAAEVSAPTTQ